MTESDEQLVAAWRQSGDRGPLETLAARHVATVRRMVHSMTIDDTLTDDLVQEVFLKAFRRLGSFEGRARFTTWLYRIAMNTVHDAVARRLQAPIDGRASLPLDAVARTDPPDILAERAEFDGSVGRALARLPPKLRAAIVLVTIEELDPADAARIEGCTRATIYWRLHEARKRLAAFLRGHIVP